MLPNGGAALSASEFAAPFQQIIESMWIGCMAQIPYQNQVRVVGSGETGLLRP
jgi:hypothetical protein